MSSKSRRRVTTVGPTPIDPTLIVRVKNGIYGGEAFEMSMSGENVWVIAAGEYGYDDVGTFELTRTEALSVAHALLGRLTEKCGADGVAGTCGLPEGHAGEHSFSVPYPSEA